MTADDERIERIDVDRVIELHVEGMRLRDQKDPGGVNRDCVDTAIGTAYLGAHYDTEEDGELDPLNVAGRLLHHLVTKHCFTDGNKRAGWGACVDILARYGVTLDVSDDEAVEFVLDIARGNGGVSAEDVIDWLADHLAGL